LAPRLSLTRPGISFVNRNGLEHIGRASANGDDASDGSFRGKKGFAKGAQRFQSFFFLAISRAGEAALYLWRKTENVVLYLQALSLYAGCINLLLKGP
jgi:hypothetical protein